MYIRKKRKEKKLEWRRAHYSKTNYGPLTRLTYSIIALLFIKTQTRTHTRTQVSIEQDNIFKCLFEQDFRWFIANRKGEIVPFSNKRHQQELLHEKLNYLNTQKRQQITLNYPASKDAAVIIADRMINFTFLMQHNQTRTAKMGNRTTIPAETGNRLWESLSG